MGKKSRSVSGMNNNIPDHISESLETIFLVKNSYSMMRIRIRDPGSGIFLIRDPGWKNSDPAFGINIPDPQHCWQHFKAVLPNA
jgi:hypothetical protein